MLDSAAASRVALITGGVRGIGRAVAVSLAERGWALAACYRKSEQEAAALETELRSKGARILLQRADVSDPATAESLVRRVEEEYGRIDALINCAGEYHRIHLMQENFDGWHSMFNNNLHPIFYLSRRLRGADTRQAIHGRGRVVPPGRSERPQGSVEHICGGPEADRHY